MVEAFLIGFNTHPPEGGWYLRDNTQSIYYVSTHSRPKAAGVYFSLIGLNNQVSTHSRPKAAGLNEKLCHV